MSEQLSTLTPVPPKRLWLAFGFWLALLAANIVTAYTAISAVTAGGAIVDFLPSFQSNQLIGIAFDEFRWWCSTRRYHCGSGSSFSRNWLDFECLVEIRPIEPYTDCVVSLA